MDLSNAFNSIDRSAVLESVRRSCPGLAPWADYCYRGSSVLLLDTERLRSMRGVQQGDPLGPALFSLAIHSPIVNTKAKVDAMFPGELDMCAFFSTTEFWLARAGRCQLSAIFSRKRVEMSV